MRSAYGTPSGSQITSDGTGSAKCATRSAGLPARCRSSSAARTISVIRGSSLRIRRAVNSGVSILRSRVCSGGCRRGSAHKSPNPQIYKAFREVGRSVRTVALLRFLADPALRRRITAVTNKVEGFNGFSAWLRFGNDGVIADNDPAEQEKMIKFNSLLANCVIFHTALDMMEVMRWLLAEGWEISAEDVAQLSPYLTAHISWFGLYATDVLRLRPDDFDPDLPEIDFTTLAEAA